MRIHRARGPHDEDRHAIAKGIVNAHHAMHEADIGVNDRRHRFAGGFGIAMCNANGMIFMQAQDHARIDIAQMVDDGIMQAAIAGTGIEAHIGKAKAAQHLRGHIACPSDFIVWLTFWLVEMHVSPCSSLKDSLA